MFAKLYETPLGQILVKADSNEEGKPEIRFHFEPENLGICEVAHSFSDTDDGWEKQESSFNEMDKEAAIAAVSKIISSL